jgi:hypothetical protein
MKVVKVTRHVCMIAEPGTVEPFAVESEQQLLGASSPEAHGCHESLTSISSSERL